MNLLVAEEEGDGAASLASSLLAMDHRVTVVATTGAVLAALEQDRFDAVVLDCVMPPAGAATAVKHLRERGLMLPVLMVSAQCLTSDTIGWLDAGADDHVGRQTPIEEIEARLKALVRARQWTMDVANTLRVGDLIVSSNRHRAWRGDRSLDLARLEFRLLVALARHAGAFLSRATLIEQVWGRDVEPATNILEAQMRSLRRKLVADGETDPIETRRGVGYMLRG